LIPASAQSRTAWSAGGHDQYALDRRVDLLDARVALLAVDLGGVRVHGNGVVAALPELLPHDPVEVLGVARDADDGHALEGQKIFDLLERGHIVLA
jgi:hypothetical protein